MLILPRKAGFFFAAILICVAHTNAFSPLRHAKAAWTKIVSPKALDMKETLQSIAATDVFGGMKGFGCGLTGYGCRRAPQYAPTSSSGMFRRNLMEQRILAEAQTSTSELQFNRQRALSSTCNGVGIVVSTETTSFDCNGTAVTNAQYDAILELQTDPNATVEALSPTIGIITVGNTTVDIEALVDIPGAAVAANTFVQSLECTNTTAVEQSCACPLDYFTQPPLSSPVSGCNTARPVTCGVQFASDELQACVTADLLSNTAGFRQCIPHKQPLELSASVSCRFQGVPTSAVASYDGSGGGVGYTCNGSAITNEYLITELTARNRSTNLTAISAEAPYFGLGCVEAGMSYAVGGSDVFAVTLLPASLTADNDSTFGVGVRLRPYNWRTLSDLSQVRTVPVPISSNGTGAVTMSVSIDPDDHRDYFYGGRVYMELTVVPRNHSTTQVGLWGTRFPAGGQIQAGPLVQFMVDDMAYLEPERYRFPAWGIALLTLAGIVLLVAIVLVAWWVHARWEQYQVSRERALLASAALGRVGDKSIPVEAGFQERGGVARDIRTYQYKRKED